MKNKGISTYRRRHPEVLYKNFVKKIFAKFHYDAVLY